MKDNLFNLLGTIGRSRAHSKVNKTWTMTSNIVEFVYATNKDAKELPALPLLEFIWQLVKRWNNTNKMNAKGTFTFL